MLKRTAVFIVFILCLAALTPTTAHAESISRAEYEDKLKGGWVGQMIGVTWGMGYKDKYGGGGKLEFNHNAPPDSYSEDWIPVWEGDKIIRGYDNNIADDVITEISFLDAMYRKGINATASDFGDNFRYSYNKMWGSNENSRNLLRGGTYPPQSGRDSRCLDLDWQIEADWAGLILPGQVDAATDLAYKAGTVVACDDGIYGGQMIAAMQAKAFTANNLREIIEAGRDALPVNSEYKVVIDGVISGYDNSTKDYKAFKQTRAWVWSNKGQTSGHDGVDSKIHGAYIIMGLLWGQGDFVKSQVYTILCANDTDSSNQNTASILGTYYGYNHIKNMNPGTMRGQPNEKFLDYFEQNNYDSPSSPIKYGDSGNDRYTTWGAVAASDHYAASANRRHYNFNDVITLSIDLAKDFLLANGGSISGSGATEVWNLPGSTGNTPTPNPPTATPTIGAPTPTPTTTPSSPGDTDGDGDVDIADLSTLLANFGTGSDSSTVPGDIDGDGDVDITDLSTLLSNFGSSDSNPPSSTATPTPDGER